MEYFGEYIYIIPEEEYDELNGDHREFLTSYRSKKKPIRKEKDA